MNEFVFGLLLCSSSLVVYAIGGCVVPFGVRVATLGIHVPAILVVIPAVCIVLHLLATLGMTGETRSVVFRNVRQPILILIPWR